MNITVLYCDDCPSLNPSLDRLKKVLSDENIKEEILLKKVESNEEAVKLKFIGSPTILINGIDIDPPENKSYFALNCRAFKKENGKISPIPPIDMIRKLVIQEK
ncbi:MAG: DUF2703 domain-containing protein [Chloroflexi bacterium]|nr:DUF2703 domain-containing protein [Chloroflexota bacterium]|tara:strand:- start:1995 stop:2306 length:312 start_codon:yes stop_codon:yes gene_type:complete